MSGPRSFRSGGVVAALSFAGICAAFMQTLVIPIQSELPALLGASRTATAWVVTSTLLVSAVGTPIAGRLGDMFGKRRVALILLGLLVAGCAVAAVATNAATLIVGRGLQGAGVAVIPLGISILRDLLPPERLAGAIALVSATLGVGAALGLPVSALVSQYFDWHLVFVVAGVLGIGAIASILIAVPAREERAGGRIDVPGIVGLSVGLVAVILAISRGNEWGWGSGLTLGLLAGGAVVLVVWGWMQLRTREPLVDLRVTVARPILLTNLASVGVGFASFAANVVFPQLLTTPVAAGGLGLTLLGASLVVMSSGIAMLVVSTIAGRLERRFGPKLLLVGAGVLLAAAYLTATLLPSFGIVNVVIINVVIGAGVGCGFAAMPTLVMRSVDRHQTGAANGFNTLMRALGLAIASAAVGAVLAGSASQDGGAGSATGGFQLAFLLACGASLACVVLAAFIPGSVPARPGGRGGPDGDSALAGGPAVRGSAA